MRRRTLDPCCPRCGYVLSGLDLSLCPECGVALDGEDWRLHASGPREAVRLTHLAFALLPMAAPCLFLLAGVSGWMELGYWPRKYVDEVTDLASLWGVPAFGVLLVSPLSFLASIVLVVGGALQSPRRGRRRWVLTSLLTSLLGMVAAWFLLVLDIGGVTAWIAD